MSKNQKTIDAARAKRIEGALQNITRQLAGLAAMGRITNQDGIEGDMEEFTRGIVEDIAMIERDFGVEARVAEGLLDRWHEIIGKMKDKGRKLAKGENRAPAEGFGEPIPGPSLQDDPNIYQLNPAAPPRTLPSIQAEQLGNQAIAQARSQPGFPPHVMTTFEGLELSTSNHQQFKIGVQGNTGEPCIVRFTLEGVTNGEELLALANDIYEAALTINSQDERASAEAMAG